MEDQKHTPGPWKVYGAAEELVIHAGEEREVITIIPRFITSEGIGGIKKKEANANLIAAAPELLEALEELSNEFKSLYSISLMKKYEVEDNDAYRKAISIIKKATGHA